MQKKSVPNFKTKQERIAFWYSICQARHASNLTSTAFCAKYKVSKSPLQKWMKYFEQYPNFSQASKRDFTTVIPPKTMAKNQQKR